MKTCIVIFLILFSAASQGQEIIYEFPKSVTDKIQEHISNYSDTITFVALLHVEEGGKYSLVIMENDFAKNFKDINNVLVTKTSRFVKINNVKMPMLTAEGVYAFAEKGPHRFNP